MIVETAAALNNLMMEARKTPVLAVVLKNKERSYNYWLQ
jgi:hypothetical protein